MADWAKVLEKILPHTGEIAADDAARAMLRQDPEKYQQYLEALAGTYGSKEQRATDMGFGKKTWYHGTNVPIEQFKNEAKGLSTNAQSAKRGFFFAEDPSTASDYAQLAHEKGVIREGDTPTTKWQSENYEEPDKLNFTDVDKARDEWREARNRTTGFLNKQKAEAEKNLQQWEATRQEDPNKYKWGLQSRGLPVDQDGLHKFVDEMQQKIADRYQQFYGNSKPATPEEIAAAKQKYAEAVKQFQANPASHKTNNVYLETKDPEEKSLLEAAMTAGRDAEQSSGQSVLPVRLRAGEGNIKTKDYQGQGYRDETYSDVMQRASDEGKSGVLFKNTEDPADPNNRVTQNIAAVFNPDQVRSEYAAYDPRFKKSSDLLAGGGALALGGQAPMPEMNAGKQAVDLYRNYIDEPRKKMLEKLSQSFLEKINPEGMPNRDKIIEGQKPIVNFAGDVATDPTSYVEGPAGLALPAIKDWLGGR